MVETTAWSAANVFTDGGPEDGDIPIWLLKIGQTPDGSSLSESQRQWLAAQKFSGAAKKYVAVPSPQGQVAGIAFGLGDGTDGEPSGPSELLAGLLPQALPAANYDLSVNPAVATLAATAWGLGAYKFQHYRSGAHVSAARPQLRAPKRLSLPGPAPRKLSEERAKPRSASKPQSASGTMRWGALRVRRAR